MYTVYNTLYPLPYFIYFLAALILKLSVYVQVYSTPIIMRAALKPRQRRSQCLTYTSTISSLWELRYPTITVNRMGKSISVSSNKARTMRVLYEVPLWLTDRATGSWRWVGREVFIAREGGEWFWDWGFLLSGRRSFNGYLMSCECGTQAGDSLSVQHHFRCLFNCLLLFVYLIRGGPKVACGPRG